jgi:hypothetical protein
VFVAQSRQAASDRAAKNALADKSVVELRPESMGGEKLPGKEAGIVIILDT